MRLGRACPAASTLQDLLDGTTSPAGLMPYTTYLANFTSRDMREVNMRAGAGTTYWWHTDPVLYQFGFGLSYSEFKFAWSNADPPVADVVVPAAAGPGRLGDVTMNHSLTVTNVGGRVSDVVALAFAVAVPGSAQDTPLRKLFGFERFVRQLWLRHHWWPFLAHSLATCRPARRAINMLYFDR